MPPAVALIAAAGLFAVGGSLSAIAASLAISLITNVVIGALTKSLSKRPKQFQAPINVTVRNSIDNRRIVFGERRVGGSYAYINVSSTNGVDNDLLWYVIALADHEVQEIGDIYIDQERCPVGSTHPVTGNQAFPTRFDGKLNIYRHTGTSSQAVDTNLDAAFAEITSNFRLRGVAYIVLKMKRDDTAFPNGAPRDVTAVVKGALLYDPRQDSTVPGGSGFQRNDIPQSWTYSENPALMVRAYLTGFSVVNFAEITRMVKYGLKETDARIDDTYVIAAANICDELLLGAEQDPYSGGLGTRRFFAGLEFTTGETHRSVMQDLLDAMAGTVVMVQGKWRIFAGAYDSPLHSFAQEDLYGELEVSDTTDGDDRYNAVSAVHIDRFGGFSEATTIFRTDAAYETQDGGERITREIDLRAVTDMYVAQRLAEIELRKSRMMRTIKITGGLNLLKVALNETFTLSHARYGWVNRVFRCVERQFELDQDAGKVVLLARQEASSVYNDLLTADYTSGISATDIRITELPNPPTSLTTDPQVTSIKITVGLPASFPPGAVVQIFEHTASTPFSSAVKVAEARQDLFIIQRRNTVGRFYWARIKALDGSLSTTFPAVTGVSGAADLAKTLDIEPTAATDMYIARQLSTSADITLDGDIGYILLTVSVPAMSRAYTAAVSATAQVNVGPNTPVYITPTGAGVTPSSSVLFYPEDGVMSLEQDFAVPAGIAATFSITTDDPVDGFSNIFEGMVIKAEAIKA